MKRIPVFDVALCYRQKKYQPGGFPASFAFTLSFFYFPDRHALHAGSIPKYFLGPVSPARLFQG